MFTEKTTFSDSHEAAEVAKKLTLKREWFEVTHNQDGVTVETRAPLRAILGDEEAYVVTDRVSILTTASGLEEARDRAAVLEAEFEPASRVKNPTPGAKYEAAPTN